MSFKIIEMNEKNAKEIVNWRYEGIHSIYNLENNEDSLNELLTHEYYSVLDSNNYLIGFYCIGEAAIVPYGNKFSVYEDRDYLDIGIGLKPEFVGKRKGYPFLRFGLDYFKSKFNNNKFRLTVFDFNKQAIQVYHKAGFVIENYFKANTGHYFLVMTLVD